MNYNILLLVFILFLSFCENQQPNVREGRPNIVLIVADDLGFSDLGCFGSKIQTPNINALAKNGQIFTQFYTAATCSPTRAMLLSGTDNHIAGLGNMAENVVNFEQQIGQPGYEGHLNDRVVSVAKLLKEASYHTYIAGKWHLGLTKDQSPKMKGFERSFTLLDAYANHYFPSKQNRSFWEDDHYTDYPKGAYSTNIYTDKLIQFIEDDHGDNAPFFLFAAYTSPHWPLQAPLKYIEKYKGEYDIGYDSLRTLRFQGLKDKNIIADSIEISDLPFVKGSLYNISEEVLSPWTSLNNYQRKLEARSMEVYAGMVDNLDYNIGRLLQHLKDIGEYDNTMFVFFSDNGAAVLETNFTPEEISKIDDMGSPNSFLAYGPQWAHASSAGYRLYKGYSAEGGIHSPMIIKMPFQEEGKGLLQNFTSVMDMAPTFLEIAGATYPQSYKGHTLTPHKGKSLIPLLNNNQDFIHKDDYVMGWELFGRCAVRKGNWKITQLEAPFGNDNFQLFNLQEDPLETKDLSTKYPEKYQEMLDHWSEYVKENGVILVDQ